MSNILIQEEWVNKTEGYRNGESGIYETRYEEGKEGQLFKSLQKEYGKCVSKVYIDDGKAIGWVFEKVSHYDDTHEPYTLETWVTLHKEQPTRTIEHHYQFLK